MTSDHQRGLANLAKRDYWRWRCDVMRVIDADTIEVGIDFGRGLVMQPVPNVYVTHVRFLGYDAPELTTDEGSKARAALFALLSDAGWRVFVNSAALDGRGRILGTIDMLDGRSVIDEMVAIGWLKPYDGHGKRPWGAT